MKTFKLSKVTKLGDMDAKYGQRYWCEVAEQLEPVMFNSMNENIEVGQTITAEEVLLKTSSKGKEYHGLKKVKLTDSKASQAPQTSSTGSVSESQINQILELLKENNEMLKQLTVPNYKQSDVVADPDEISLSDIPF